MGGEGRGEQERTGLRDRQRDSGGRESIILHGGKEEGGEGSSFMHGVTNIMVVVTNFVVVVTNIVVVETNIMGGRVFVVVWRGKWKGGGWRSSLSFGGSCWSQIGIC